MPLTTRDLVSLRVDIMKNKKKYDRDKVVAGVASALAMLIGAVSVFYGFSLDHITICNCPIELPGQAPCYCIGHGYFDMTFFVWIGILLILLGLWWATLAYYKRGIIHITRRA